jgi:LmbE family N-acetylglucosaminyl deacetylase
MLTLDRQHSFYDIILENAIRPFLLRNEFKRYAHFLRSTEKALKGESCTRPSIITLQEKARILVIAPHPDDEILGCGGTIGKFIQNGSHIKTLFLTDGSHGNNTIEQQFLVNLRKLEAKAGLKILGSDDLEFFNFKDSELRATRETIRMMLSLIEDYHPEIIFLPFFLDNHPDHKESAVIAAHALNRYKVPVVCYCYEVWTALFPNVLIDITDMMDKKIRAIEAHESQVSHLNLVSSVIGLNSYRSLGLSEDVKFCEAFYKCSKEQFIKMVLR